MKILRVVLLFSVFFMMIKLSILSSFFIILQSLIQMFKSARAVMGRQLGYRVHI